MQRPDLDTLACVNTDCQYYGRPGQGNLTIRKVGGVADLHFIVMYAILTSSHKGGHDGTHPGALSPLSKRSGYQGRQDSGRQTTLQVPKRELPTLFISA